MEEGLYPRVRPGTPVAPMEWVDLSGLYRVPSIARRPSTPSLGKGDCVVDVSPSDAPRPRTRDGPPLHTRDPCTPSRSGVRRRDGVSSGRELYVE